MRLSKQRWFQSLLIGGLSMWLGAAAPAQASIVTKLSLSDMTVRAEQIMVGTVEEVRSRYADDRRLRHRRNLCRHHLARGRDVAAAVMDVEQVPNIPMFRKNTAAFVHELPAGSIANVDGDSNYVRVQVLTNAGALDRDKQVAVGERLTAIIAAAAGADSLAQRIWVLLTEAPEGGWGLWGHAHTNAELVTAARAEIARQSGA